MDLKLAVKDVPLDKLKVPTRKWSRKISSAHVGALVQSIERHGLFQPIVGRKVNGSIELIAGRHRYDAAEEVGADTVPVVIIDADDTEAEMVALEENLRRKRLNKQQAAEALDRYEELWTQEHGPSKPGRQKERETPRLSFPKEAKKAGVSKRHIHRQRARKKKLVPKVYEAWQRGEIKDTAADELTKLARDEQLKMLPKVKGKSRDETRKLIKAHASLKSPDKLIDDLVSGLMAINSLAAKLNTKLQEVRGLVRKLGAKHGDALKVIKISHELITLADAITELRESLDAVRGGRR